MFYTRYICRYSYSILNYNHLLYTCDLVRSDFMGSDLVCNDNIYNYFKIVEFTLPRNHQTKRKHSVRNYFAQYYWLLRHL